MPALAGAPVVNISVEEAPPALRAGARHRSADCPPHVAARREAYLRTFERYEPQAKNEPRSLLAAPKTPEDIVERLARNIVDSREAAALFLGIEVEVPTVYLYPNVEDLRAHACVNEGTVAYYDGSAIHLASLETSLQESFEHELVHHALASLKVRVPTWLDEGMAMRFSGERRRDFRPAHRRIELSVMAAPFSQASSLEYADEFYGQAVAMVNFLEALCVRPARNKAPSDPFQHCSNATLIDALRRGVPAERLFEAALRDRAGDVSWQPLAIWHDYLERGRLEPGIRAELLAKE